MDEQLESSSPVQHTTVVLGPVDFSLFLSGRTGIGKTELASRAQQFFGRAMEARQLPANWSSTANALERIAWVTKNAVLVVDDFSPQGRAEQVARAHAEADRLLRAQGNASGRQRLKPAAQLLPTYKPRGLLLATGEEVPRGESLRARLFVLPMAPGDMNLVALTWCQQLGAQRVFAQAMAAFIQWLAPVYDGADAAEAAP